MKAEVCAVGFLARAEPSVTQMPMSLLAVIDYAEAVFDLANTGDLCSYAGAPTRWPRERLEDRGSGMSFLVVWVTERPE
jgi:hypothetical protein